MEELEHWLPVLGYEGLYEVSDLGRVRSLPHLVPSHYGPRMSPGRIRIPQVAGKGYQAVALSGDGVRVQRYIHALVLEAFVGPCPDGMECLHTDDDKTNNRLDNLRWDTHAANQHEMADRGLSASGSRNGNAALTEDLVAEIRAALRLGDPGVVLAARYGVSTATISRIRNRVLWANVP